LSVGHRRLRYGFGGFITIISRGVGDDESRIIVFCLYSSGLERNVRRVESFSRHGGSSYAWIRRPDLTGYARPCDDKSIVFQSRFHAIFRLILGPRGRTDPMFLYSDPTWGSPYGSAQTIPLPLHLLDRRNSSTVIDFSIRTHSLDRWVMLRRIWGSLRHHGGHPTAFTTSSPLDV